MDQLDLKSDVPGGGRAGGGGCFHVSFRSGSRAGGASARAGHAYITRTDEYDSPDLDEAIYTESDHMPSWAEDDPADYWEAADLYERANGRLYVSADFALPLGLDADPGSIVRVPKTTKTVYDSLQLSSSDKQIITED